MTTGAHADIQLDSEAVRVTRWTIEPGGVIPMHVHEHPYVVVPVTTGTMHIVGANGAEVDASIVAGESYARDAGVQHEVSNPSPDEPVVFVEVERLA